MPKELKLKVAEAIQDDVNKGIVRVDTNLMHDIDVRPGDILEIEGERKTVGIADRAYPGDIGLNIIRMDGIIRRNAKTGIGESVTVRKADVKEAKKVIIAPAQKGIVIRASNPQLFKQGLLGRALMKGDIVRLGGTQRRRSTMERSPFFNDMFSEVMNDMGGFGFTDIKFLVADTAPKQSVVVTELTEVVFNPEAVEIAEEKVLEVTYEDVGGLSEEIRKIREMVELPLKHPEIFERLGIEPPKGVLLHGPPGTGKTLLAKAVANETASNFSLINGPEIMSKFYGQSEANLRAKFEEAEKNAPSIIFIDEIDAIAPKREESYGEVERRVVAQLLGLMDGLKSRGKVVVIAASNIPDMLDPALRRPGRFDREVEIGVPTKEGRLTILKIHTRNMPLRGTWYEDCASEELKRKVEESLTKIDQDEESYKQKIPALKADSDKLQEELADLEKLKGKRDETVTGRIMNRASQINTRIDKNRQEEKELKSHLSSFTKNRAELSKKKDLLLKKKDLLDRIVEQAREIERIREMWSADADEARTHFLDMTKGKLDEEVRMLTADLIGLSVIDRGYYTNVEKKGIARDLRKLAAVTYGFVGADLAALTREAAMEVLRRILPEMKLQEDEPIPKENLEMLRISLDDFREALRVVRPSAMREVLIEVPNVKWRDIGGLDGVKQELIEAVEWPLKNPKRFTRLGVKPPKGVLLYGAPGTGKTLLAKAVATESKANFIPVKGPELLSKWFGESEKAVRKIFKKARQTAPSIIFFDEIDSIAPSRGRGGESSHATESVVNQLLTEMGGLEDLNEVVIIAATNRPDILDTALLRPGRFDRIVYAPAPDVKSRELIFKIHAKNMPLKAVDLKELARRTEGYVGADIESICREAAMFALPENVDADSVTLKHFEAALEKVAPSITKDIEKSYEDLRRHFSQARGKEMQEEKPSYMG